MINSVQEVYFQISHGFSWGFPQAKSDLPTIAVGGSVDKLFVKGWEGRRGWCWRVLVKT